MSTTTIRIAKVHVPPPVATPRGAEWASALLSAAARLGRRVWRALERVGQARAERELRGLAERHTDRPEFAAALRDSMNRAAMQRDSRGR